MKNIPNQTTSVYTIYVQSWSNLLADNTKFYGMWKSIQKHIIWIKDNCISDTAGGLLFGLHT